MMRIGLIAGNGTFPFLVLDAARRLGYQVTVVAIKEEAWPALEEVARRDPGTDCQWISLGQLGACVSAFRSAGVTRAVMAGNLPIAKGLAFRGEDRRCYGARTYGRAVDRRQRGSQNR